MTDREGSIVTGVDAGNYVSPLFISASHELKSPLALIRQLSLALTDETLTQKDLENIAERITLTSERALRLTTDLTKAHRLEDSFFALEPLNPLQLVEEVVDELSPLYRAHGKTISFSHYNRPVLAVANRDLLRRVLLNFADNALHYSDKNTTVEFNIHRQKSNIRMSVRDYGPAIPSDIWQKLSSTIGRSGQVIHNRPASSGLGLMVAMQFAEAMNGRIGAKRHSDGTTFYVDLAASTQLSLL